MKQVGVRRGPAGGLPRRPLDGLMRRRACGIGRRGRGARSAGALAARGVAASLAPCPPARRAPPVARPGRRRDPAAAAARGARRRGDGRARADVVPAAGPRGSARRTRSTAGLRAPSWRARAGRCATASWPRPARSTVARQPRRHGPTALVWTKVEPDAQGAFLERFREVFWRASDPRRLAIDTTATPVVRGPPPVRLRPPDAQRRRAPAGRLHGQRVRAVRVLVRRQRLDPGPAARPRRARSGAACSSPAPRRSPSVLPELKADLSRQLFAAPGPGPVRGLLPLVRAPPVVPHGLQRDGLLHRPDPRAGLGPEPRRRPLDHPPVPAGQGAAASGAAPGSPRVLGATRGPCARRAPARRQPAPGWHAPRGVRPRPRPGPSRRLPHPPRTAPVASPPPQPPARAPDPHRPPPLDVRPLADGRRRSRRRGRRPPRSRPTRRTSASGSAPSSSS